MLVVFKSAPILKRALKVKQAMMQLYVLKLLKIQTKYLGRQWRKSNMKTMSAIYQKVRHRLNDDWAYGNGRSHNLCEKMTATTTVLLTLQLIQCCDWLHLSSFGKGRKDAYLCSLYGFMKDEYCIFHTIKCTGY